jgi:hypothetical protein
MTIRTLAEVGARLEETVKGLPGDGHDLFDRYEMVAIQILDSEFPDFAPGLLERYLSIYLDLKRLELGSEPST